MLKPGNCRFSPHTLEPAILVMHHSMKPHPAITATLLDFMCRVSAAGALSAFPSCVSSVQCLATLPATGPCQRASTVVLCLR